MASPETHISFTPMGIFEAAGPVVQAVIIILLIASIASWSIMIARWASVFAEQKRMSSLAGQLAGLTDGDALSELCRTAGCAGSRVLSSVGGEWDWSARNSSRSYDQVRSRILSVIDMSVATEAGKIAGRMSWLATIGSIAPFVGLFGTVWGIMDSFVSIGQTQDTSLAVVAPGIAEALMATAIGLFCAIPAVIGYNRLLSALAQLESGWRSMAGQVEVAISRQFEAGVS